MRLIVGNKNYSSWSLRPWLALRVAGIAFEEHRIPLYVPGSKEEILSFSPAGKVPCLVEEASGGEIRVWDSPAMHDWIAAAEKEVESILQFEQPREPHRGQAD